MSKNPNFKSNADGDEEDDDDGDVDDDMVMMTRHCEGAAA